jgi:hypothetical protein
MVNRCKSRKKDGKPCRANAQPTNGLCVFHDPARAAEGRNARRAGGITRSRVAAVLPSDTPDHQLGNTTDVSAFLADSINQLRRGQLDPRVANAMGYLTSVLLRSLEQGPVEERPEAEPTASFVPSRSMSVIEIYRQVRWDAPAYWLTW